MYVRVPNIIKLTIVKHFNVLVVLLSTMSNAYISTTWPLYPEYTVFCLVFFIASGQVSENILHWEHFKTSICFTKIKIRFLKNVKYDPKCTPILMKKEKN